MCKINSGACFSLSENCLSAYAFQKHFQDLFLHRISLAILSFDNGKEKAPEKLIKEAGSEMYTSTYSISSK